MPKLKELQPLGSSLQSQVLSLAIDSKDTQSLATIYAGTKKHQKTSQKPLHRLLMLALIASLIGSC